MAVAHHPEPGPRRGASPAVRELDPDVLASLPAPTDATGMEEADRAATVREALGRLPVEQSRALLLAAYYGRTGGEISASGGIPLGTAKTRIRLGLRKIRALLMAPGEDRP